MREDKNVIDITKEIEKLKKLREEMQKNEQVKTSNEKGFRLEETDRSLENLSEKKVMQLRPSRNPSRIDKRAGYVDALILAFMVASIGIATLLCMLVRINMSGF